MNKILSIISLAALGIGFVACDEVEESLSQPQTNPQESIFDAANLQVAPEQSVLDLKALNNANEPAVVAKYTVSDFPVASTVGLTMQMSKTEDFAQPVSLKTTIDPETSTASIAADALQAAYYSKITRNPAAGSVYVRFAAYAQNGTEDVRLGGPDVYYGAGQLSIKPFDPVKVIEDAYYVVTPDGAVKMDHSDVNQYDDPVFTYLANVTTEQAAQGYEWYIIPASTQAGGASVAYGPEANKAAGELVEATVADVAKGVINAEGPHMIKINMYDMTYEANLAIDELYTPGDSNGWNGAASQVLTRNWNYTQYRGFAYLSGSFKITSQPDWNGLNYGAAVDPETGAVVPGGLSLTGGNLSVPKAALYWVYVNLPELTYKATEIESLGLIGSFNDWTPDNVVEMSHSADYLVWTGTFDLKVDDEWKIMGNHDWGINLGGALDEMVYDGANIKCEEAGTYTITLDLSTLPYTASLVKQN